MSDVKNQHQRALMEFGRRVRAVTPDQWSAATPCSDWDVRALVHHLVVEQLWVPDMLAGRTVEEVGDRYEGDRMGDDVVGAWEDAAAKARDAVERVDLEQTVHLSYGDVPAEHYVAQMTADLAVHAWDLARGIGGDENLDNALVEWVYDFTLPHADALAASGLFADLVPVPEGADAQTRLIALYGRQP